MSVSFSFISGAMYVWAKYEPGLTLTFYGIPFKSEHFPWVYCGFTLITGGDVIAPLIGIAAGHTFIFFKIILPRSHGYNFLNTPKFFEKYVNKIIASRSGRSRVRNLGGGVDMRDE